MRKGTTGNVVHLMGRNIVSLASIAKHIMCHRVVNYVKGVNNLISVWHITANFCFVLFTFLIFCLLV